MESGEGKGDRGGELDESAQVGEEVRADFTVRD